MAKYDYLIVGAGLFGSVFAHEAREQGKKCLVIDRRSHRGGNVFCEERDGIRVHKYGAHIFHTSIKPVWEYVTRFAEFNSFINSPVANYKGQLYNLPFNMNTFHEMWGVVTPQEAEKKIAEQRSVIKGEPQNLEEQAISLVGTDIYEKLIRGYTEKQWGRSCKELPAFIIRRLPVRYTYDNNYFNDRYQGIPIGGYNVLIDRLLEWTDVELDVDFLKERRALETMADCIIYTGTIDAYFDYLEGELEYRGLRFVLERHDINNYQGVAVMNFTDSETSYTRIIEHRHFDNCDSPVTWITKEYPAAWKQGEEPYYPVNDERNQALYKKYAALADRENKVIFGGRLGEYQYYDMDKVIARALECAKTVFS